jgi:4-aminobutyrate aminotransferase-like enzyme
LKARQVLNLLRDYESRNITFIEEDHSWPIVWERAQGVNVWDAEGKKYLDLTAAFGVAAAGHANRKVVQAGQRQMARLLHAMGDVHPHALKARLARELSRLTFERWTANSKKPHRGKTIFCNSGFEAVEAALKTAMLATGKPGVVAFERSYHGLGYGALSVGHRQHFRSPFQKQLAEFATFVTFPTTEELGSLERELRQLLESEEIGAILLEPIQVRGGIHIPPLTLLPMLRQVCDDYGALLILDEIYTGFGRTGKWFACEHSETAPDLICLGKALTGGFPLSACVGRAGCMDKAWPVSSGEAMHTSTFLGHPVGCAMALANIQELKRLALVKQAATSGTMLLRRLKSMRAPGNGVEMSARGLGLLAGVELRTREGKPATDLALRSIKQMLHRGFILLPEGEHANIISFSPPLIISDAQLIKTVAVLEQVLQQS